MASAAARSVGGARAGGGGARGVSAEQIETILRQVESLPTLPTIATRLLSISSLDDADLDQLVEIIESDPTLTARLLGLCRSAEKGAPLQGLQGIHVVQRGDAEVRTSHGDAICCRSTFRTCVGSRNELLRPLRSLPEARQCQPR
ncbi:HDOD domain-containing protein [Leptolyngbya sp. 15MV]|nr:HDOD domain-containing protein [Leptolyngbya sp. 15MV]